MKVKLRHMWFAPTDKVIERLRGAEQPRSISGRRLRPGVHELPEHLRDFLPSTARILDIDGNVEVDKLPNDTIKDFDIDRISADQAEKALVAAENRRAGMEKARAAKATKAEQAGA